MKSTFSSLTPKFQTRARRQQFGKTFDKYYEVPDAWLGFDMPHARWDSFNGEESPPSASRAASRDDYTMIFYPPASVAVGGGFRLPAFPKMELEYVGAVRVHEFARRNLPRSLMLNATEPMGFSLGSSIWGSWEPPVHTRK
ncbi:hypothetical protein Scep_001664 [Stephania cephalantha]|uniref:Uncharacterized protein n=1 Tax=Stephania cephalantha TaxID=152367 RepID=A0AAP0L9S6_9MAGN